MHKRLNQLSVGLAIAFALVGTAAAQSVEMDTTGEDNLTDPRYYGVQFNSAGAYSGIASISLDISADIDAVFDLDGVSNFGGATEPVVDLGSLNGLTAGDITWSFVGSNPNVITASFAPGSFGVGDSFRFAAETDLFVADPCKGGNFATGGALFSVQFEDGPLVTVPFVQITIEESVATAEPSACQLTLALPKRTVQQGELLPMGLSLTHNAPWATQTPFNAALIDPGGNQLLSWESRPKSFATGQTVGLQHAFVIPTNAKPGIYTLNVGVGEMRQGLVLRTVQVEVIAKQVAPAGGQGGVAGSSTK